jgi:KUP system potassium uptake protein
VAAVVTDQVARVGEDDRIDMERIADGLDSVVIHFGFMEEPDVPAALAKLDS